MYFEMKKTTKHFLLILTCCLSTVTFAQLDGSFGGDKEGTSTLGKISAPSTD